MVLVYFPSRIRDLYQLRVIANKLNVRLQASSAC